MALLLGSEFYTNRQGCLAGAFLEEMENASVHKLLGSILGASQFKHFATFEFVVKTLKDGH